MSLDISKFMQPEEMKCLGVRNMTDVQRDTLVKFGLRMFGLGQHIVADIDEIKFDGRLIILNDGSRREVDSIDASTADLWSPMDKVVVIDDGMFKLDDLEKVAVQQDED